MPRLAVIGAVTALLLIASAAMGGMSSAADRLSEWGTAVSHVVAASPPAPGKTKLGFAPANSQYQSAPAIVPGAPPRAGYCAVAGNKLPNGTLIPAGTFLNLALGQPAVDSDYTGAQPAFYVRGVGLTCDIPSPLYKLANVGPVDSLGQPNPPGITLEGNIYPLYVKSAF